MILINDREMGAISRDRNPTRDEHLGFRSWLKHKYGTEVLPVTVEDALYSKAWDLGHANGYGEVTYSYCELADLVVLAYRTK